MDGSTVEMTIKRFNAEVTIRADISAASGNQYFEEFVINCGDGTQNVRAFLTTENGHLVIDNDATAITDTPDPTTTGINAANAVVNSRTVRYNLAGQQVAADYKGVVIENGRKVVVK